MRAHKIGRPIKTQSAPIAKALRTSLPLEIPPSKYISTLWPSKVLIFLRELTTSSKQEIVDYIQSNYLDPWFDTITASAPFLTANKASSAQDTPLAITGI